MKRDRRRISRVESGRRRSDRISDYKTVWWRGLGDEEYHCGWLVEWSGHGVGLLTERPDAPAVGERIVPKHRPDLRAWRRTAEVRRVEKLSGLLCLVGAEYVERPDAKARPIISKPALIPDRRGADRGHFDRRRSIRWNVNKPMTWRVQRGRRDRDSIVVERSLDGFVMKVAKADAVEEGSRVAPADQDGTENFGFRCAVVRRVESGDQGTKLIVAEIET